MAAGRGYHARVVNRAKGDTDCARCHTEHYGREFSIIRRDEVSPETFDHRQTGYPLEGAHARLTCQKCHTGKFISASERGLIKVRDTERTFLGLTTQCLSCHKDYHHGQLSADCAKCHLMTAWKPASHFEHADSRYPLTGLHQPVACAKCHTKDDSGLVRFRGVAFAACTDCHKDPHHGAFQSSGACDSCHVTTGWKQVRMSAGFDHGRTRFPLRGKHAALRCFDCHKNSDFKQPVAHALCLDCHKDPHSGQFVARTDKGDCGPCHNEVAFRPAVFTVRDHGRTAYPLLGKHAATDCAKCHLPAGKATRYKVAFDACTACHKDAHAGQFAGLPHRNRCEDCHTVDGFRPSTYTVARHMESRFPLRGSHAASACADCHKPAAGQPKTSPPLYLFSSLECVACHADPHGGQFLAATGGGASRTCDSCHGLRTWKEMPGFDHSRTGFPLQGAHRAVACAECHRVQKPGAGVKGVVFRGAPVECAKCHEDIHARQFDIGGATTCGRCHTPVAWRPAAFDHEKTSFPLTGLHRQVPCADCHKGRAGTGSKPVVLYKPTPSRCVSCHSDLKTISAGPVPRP